MPKLEDLELKIKQTTANTQGIKGMATALKNLAESTSKMGDVGNDIKKVSDALRHFPVQSADSVKGFATAFLQLKNVSQYSSTIASSIRQVSRALNELVDNIDVGKLTAIANAMEKVKDASKFARVGTAVKTAAKGATGAQSLGDTTEEITETMEATAESANDATEALANTGNAAAVSSEKMSKLKAIFATVGYDFARDADHLKEMNEVLSETNQIATHLDLRDAHDQLQAALVGGDSDQISSAIANYQDVLSRYPALLDKTAVSASSMSSEMNLASKVVRDFGEAVQGVGIVGIASLKGLVKGFQKVYSIGWEVAKLPLTRLGNALSNIGKKAKNLVSSFGRIAMYRALRTAIKAITTGFSEGIKHLYQWSELTGNNFKNSMDSLATSAHYLRDSLGAMASPLIDALAPAIDAIVEKFVGLLNVVNQFIAAFTGKDTWRKAVKTPTTYSGAMKEAAENTRKATKAQKELNKALQGFDELNLITTSEIKARNPASGSGNNDTGVSSTEFETKPVADWIQAIKKAIEDGDWAGAGTLLAEKLNGLVEDWKAKEFGNKIGEKFQKGLDFYLAFMNKFKWEDLGTKIGAMFNGIFETMSAEDLGHALVAHIKAGVSLAKGFLEEAKPAFENLGVAVSTAINDFFDPDFAVEFGETIAAGVNDAIAFLKTAIVGTEKVLQNYDTGETFTIKVGGIDFKQVGQSLMTSIFTAIKEINWTDLGTTMAGLFTGIIDAINAGIEYAATHISELATALKDFAIAFFKGIWEWFWPAFREYLFGGEYTAGANDRKDGPVTTGAGMTREEKETQFDTELDSAVAGFKGSLEWIEEHNPFNVEVTDNGNTIGTQDEKVGGLNDKLDYTDGTFTSTFGTKNLKDTEKKVNPFKETLDKTKGKFDAFFGTKDLDKTKKRVDPYYTTLRGVGKTYTTTFATKNLDDTKKKVEELNKQLAATGKNWKLTITADLRLKPHQGSYYTVEPMAEGGFPSRGSLFVAGEVPGQTEMVGNINGRTGVASGAEITGIADAVYNTGETEAELLRQQNILLRQILSKGFNVNLAPTAAAGKWVNQATTAYARATG